MTPEEDTGLQSNFPKTRNNQRLFTQILISVIVVTVIGFSIGTLIRQNNKVEQEQAKTLTQLKASPTPFPIAEPIVFDFKKYNHKNNKFLMRHDLEFATRFGDASFIKETSDDDLAAFDCKLDLSYNNNNAEKLYTYDQVNRTEKIVTEKPILDALKKAIDKFNLNGRFVHYSICKTEDNQTFVWITEDGFLPPTGNMLISKIQIASYNESTGIDPIATLSVELGGLLNYAELMPIQLTKDGILYLYAGSGEAFTSYDKIYKIELRQKTGQLILDQECGPKNPDDLVNSEKVCKLIK